MGCFCRDSITAVIIAGQSWVQLQDPIPGAGAAQSWVPYAATDTAMICVTSNCPESVILALGVREWPVWACEISSFPWHYDQRETCLLLEGDVTVTPDDGEPVRFGAGDLVEFPAGLSCTWQVHQPVRKHYQFG